MNDDDSQSLGPELGGWGTPEPAPDFADRVAQRVRPVAPAATPSVWRRWAAPLLVGAIAGAAATALVVSDARTGRSTTLSVMQAGPSAEVLAEPGSRVDWSVDGRGRVQVDVVRGVAWVRVLPEGDGVVLRADGEEFLPPGSCVRASVLRSASDEDINVDAVDCAAYDDARENVES